jgi:tetratricopeptide (TPR) repeat protein
VTYSKILLLGVLSCLYLAVSAQVGVDYDLNKPKKFENRILASETSNNGKKFKKSRRFIQNTITHYNFYYNANFKLNMVVAKAKTQFRDDYSHLLPFYNYSLDATLAQKKELDSVIYKCTMGILIHDVRNDWIDNLYFLIGKTYYYKKDFDSAYITLQFLNWGFAPRDKDGYYETIASNSNELQGNNASIISTKEDPNILQKVFSLPPSRNDGLVWKVRTYIAQEKFAEASALIEILLHDPQFPPRLMPNLQEVRALWFYKQDIYDSAAIYLERALPAAENREEVARWEYLIAQLHEKDSDSYNAKLFYERTISHTYNPVLDVYARLNAIRQTKDGSEDYIARNIAALTKMAHRDRYESYRDIIYYTAAQMELERHNKPGAIADLRLCIKSSIGSTNNQRNKAFLQLGNLSYEAKDYRSAKNFYDSLLITGADVGPKGELQWLPDRKRALATIVQNMDVIYRQDSLQRIAAMVPAQRDAYVKKLVKYLRKQQGLRDEADSNLDNNSPFRNNNSAAPDLFSANTGADWYFDNQALKAKGYSDFRTKFGNRPNVDNWQISSIMRTGIGNGRGPGGRNTPDLNDSLAKAGASTVIDFKTLLSHLPLTPDKIKKSNDSIEGALFILGRAYQDGIPDYPYAINTYDSLLNRFPNTSRYEETLFNLYYCYTKLGDQENAQRILQLMTGKYPNGAFTLKAINPDAATKAAEELRINATHQYERVYIAFIEGRFDEALAEKKVADSLYGDKYWTPQLLYIESVYFIRTNQDMQARSTLTSITNKWPKTPMAAKAATLLDVLSRRRQIEDYLTKLQVTRKSDDDDKVDTTTTSIRPADTRPRLVRNDSNMLVKEDTSSWARAKQREQALAGTNGGKPTVPGIAPGKLKTDTSSMNKISMDAGKLDNLHKLQDSLHAAMAKATADSMQSAKLKRQSDSVNAALQKLRDDTAQLAAKLRTLNSVFTLTPDKPHSVILVLDKVDPVYVSEAGNAFNRYNTETYYSLSLTTQNASLNDSLKLLVISNFKDADAALDYLRNVKGSAPRAIIPWMPAGKYSFQIISSNNLELLLNNKDMNAYRKFLSAAYPDKL